MSLIASIGLVWITIPPNFYPLSVLSHCSEKQHTTRYFWFPRSSSSFHFQGPFLIPLFSSTRFVCVSMWSQRILYEKVLRLTNVSEDMRKCIRLNSWNNLKKTPRIFIVTYMPYNMWPLLSHVAVYSRWSFISRRLDMNGFIYHFAKC